MKLMRFSYSRGYLSVRRKGSRSRFGCRLVVIGRMERFRLRKCGVRMGRFSNSLTLEGASANWINFSCGINSVNRVSVSDKK